MSCPLIIKAWASGCYSRPYYIQSRQARCGMSLLLQQVAANAEIFRAMLVGHFSDEVIDPDLVVLAEKEVDLLRRDMDAPVLLKYLWRDLGHPVEPLQSRDRIRAGWKGLQYGGSLKKRKRKK